MNFKHLITSFLSNSNHFRVLKFNLLYFQRWSGVFYNSYVRGISVENNEHGLTEGVSVNLTQLLRTFLILSHFQVFLVMACEYIQTKVIELN